MLCIYPLFFSSVKHQISSIQNELITNPQPEASILEIEKLRSLAQKYSQIKKDLEMSHFAQQVPFFGFLLGSNPKKKEKKYTSSTH